MASGGCQRDIAQKILDKKADYVLALKGNQGSLREDVELFTAEQQANGFADTEISCDTTIGGNHGCIETRTTTVIHDVQWRQARHGWPGLKAVVVVESSHEITGKTEHETRFYLTSRVMVAALLGPVLALSGLTIVQLCRYRSRKMLGRAGHMGSVGSTNAQELR